MISTGTLNSLAGRLLASRRMLLLLVLLPLVAWGQISQDDLLPADEAFAVSASADGSRAIVQWDIAPEYYMYRHQFRFDTDTEGARIGEPELPPGEATVDEFFGETETYRDEVRVVVPFESLPPDGRVRLQLRSQGCADLGVCYPPHAQQVEVQLDPLPESGEAGGALALEGADAEVPRQSGLGKALGELGSSQGRSGLAGLGRSDQALPAEEAFSFEAMAIDPGTILVRFTAQPGYYMYREQFAFHIDDPAISVARTSLPDGEPIEDEYFGQTRVYFGEVEIPVHLARPAGPELVVDLRAEFQGCKQDGICYPPMERSLSVELPETPEAVRLEVGQDDDVPAATGGTAPPVSEQDRLARALTGSPIAAMGLFLLAGILLAFTPCVFPMVPILSALIAGEGDRMTTGRAFRLSLVYVLAMALVYTLFGVVAGLFGQNLQAIFQNPVVLVTFAGIFVLLSLAMFGFYELQLPSSWQTRLSQISNRQESGTLMGAGIMGALSALIVGPCVAAPLMAALIVIGQTGDAVLGGSALFALSLGMGLPLIVWGTSAGRLLPRAGQWMNAVKAVFGVGMLALAIWMLERILPVAVVMLMWGSLAIACGVYLGALTRLEPTASGWQKLWQALGVMLLVLGIFQFIGAASGARDWTRPLGGLIASGGTAGAPEVRFQPIETTSELDAALASAPGPVFLDFYADWCVDCLRMERRTFPDPEVASRLAGFTSLKIDVTAYDADDQALLERFGLIGPPAYLFFNQGRELEGHRLYGFSAPGPFAQHLDRVANQP